MDIRQLAHRIDVLERDFAQRIQILERDSKTYWGWIQHLERERKAHMARIDELEGVVSQIVEDYATRAQDQQALEDRIGAAADRLREAHATLMGDHAPAAVAEAPVSPQAHETTGYDQAQ